MKTKAIMLLIAVLFGLWAGTSFAAGRGTPGAVYAMTNDADENAIVIFDRKADGTLTEVAAPIETGGKGSGPLPANQGLDPLGSQGSLVLSQDHRWLLAVNAGSDEISVFKVLPGGLRRVDKVDSGGEFPVSITIYHNLVYVLNASTPNITAFTLSFRGELTPVADSTRSLVSGAFAQVGFDPQGNNLVVTDKGDHEILVFSLERDGTPSAVPVTTPSSGIAPFGFIFDRRGHLLVSEAGSGAASSYRILPDNTLQVISASLGNGQAATCWLVGNNRGDIFTSNTASGTVSAYKLLAGNGRLLLRDATAGFASTPIDMAITADGRFLYALDPAEGAVHMYRIARDGSLTDLDAIIPAAGLSIFANGIAAR